LLPPLVECDPFRYSLFATVVHDDVTEDMVAAVVGFVCCCCGVLTIVVAAAVVALAVVDWTTEGIVVYVLLVSDEPTDAKVVRTVSFCEWMLSNRKPRKRKI